MEENGNKNKFGNLLTELRTKKNMTQRELAEKLMVSDKTISRWETGGSLPDMDMIHAISKFFKISINDLSLLRVESKEGNEEIVHDMIKEFSYKDKQKIRIIKIISIIAISIITFISGAFIFSLSYNKFKVYNVIIKSDDMYPTYGNYVETKIKNTLSLNNLMLRNYTIKNTDNVSVDLYFLLDDNENILYSYNNLYNIKFIDSESYIKIKSLNKYFDNLYIKVTIIDSNNNIKTFKGKIEFALDFSNNKIYNNNDNSSINNDTINLNPEEIKIILINNGFENTSEGVFIKKNNKQLIQYYLDSNKFYHSFEKDTLLYHYVYDINKNELTVNVLNKNNIEIENYVYDVTSSKVTECITGKCNSYKEAMNKINKDILYMFNN